MIYAYGTPVNPDEVATLSARERYEQENDISGWTGGGVKDEDEEEDEFEYFSD